MFSRRERCNKILQAILNFRNGLRKVQGDVLAQSFDALNEVVPCQQHFDGFGGFEAEVLRNRFFRFLRDREENFRRISKDAGFLEDRFNGLDFGFQFTGIAEILEQGIRRGNVIATQFEGERALRGNDELWFGAENLFGVFPPVFETSLGDDFALHEVFECIKRHFAAIAGQGEADEIGWIRFGQSQQGWFVRETTGQNVGRVNDVEEFGSEFQFE